MDNQPTLKIKDLTQILGISNHILYRIIKKNGLETISAGGRNLLPPQTVRYILEQRGFSFKKRGRPLVLNLCGMKGGIGKTSLATAISQGMARIGFRVLAVDVDMQGNLTQSFDKKSSSSKVLYNILEGDAELTDVIMNVHENLDILPSSLSNSAIELLLSTKEVDTPHMLNNVLEPVFSNYDVIVIDCPPSVNKITSCAIMFADLNLIPINADTDSFDGVVMSISEIKRLERTYKSQGIKIDYRVVFNKYDAREKINLSIMGKMDQNEEVKSYLHDVVIRTDTAFKNSKAECMSIFDVNKSVARQDCLSLITNLSGIASWVSESQQGERTEDTSLVGI